MSFASANSTVYALPPKSIPGERIEAREPGRPLALKLTFFRECSILRPKQWLIKGVIAKGESSSWFGPPGALKSQLVTELAVHVAAAMDWRGYRSKEAGGVVYFAFERAPLVRRRQRAYALRDGFEDLPIAIAGDIVNMMHPSCVGIMSDTIKAAEDQFGRAVGLIVIDTVNKGIAAGSGDEDKARDQNIVAANLKRLHEQFNLHIAGVGHTGKDESRGERGSNARLGDVDLQVQISGGGDLKTATVLKANDQADGVLTSFKSEPVLLGHDEDGDEEVTHILASERFEGVSSQPAKVAKPTPAALIALRALSEALADQGNLAPPSTHIPAGSRVVPLKVWQQQAYRSGISSSDGELAKRMAFNRGSEWLIAHNRVGVWDDLVWLPRTEQNTAHRTSL